MKRHFQLLILVSGLLTSCQVVHKEDYSWLKNSLDVASAQLELSGERLKGSGMFPRSIHQVCDTAFVGRQLERNSLAFVDSIECESTKEQEGKIMLCPPSDWTSGFFPGSLWYAYEMTGKDSLKELACHYTNQLNQVRYIKNTHDVGFMVNCSYGNAWRLLPNDTIKNILIQTSNNLCGRFNDTIKSIRSWDFGGWNYPVIIDNMMNLELLFNTYKLTGNNRLNEVAVKHAKTTMRNHFRPDYTCYHVVSYKNDGMVESKTTHQGKHNESSWARGQAWAVYSYTFCFRETRDSVFLKHAEHVADMIIQRVKTKDLIPLWDYDAINSSDTPRDASAAAITASALIELHCMTKRDSYLEYAETILKNLSSDVYLAKVGKNQNFILMHSTGSVPNGFEIDVPLNYADYYYLEALKRYMDVKGIKYTDL